MPIININGVECSMTVAELIEYQKLSASGETSPVLPTPPQPDPVALIAPVAPRPEPKEKKRSPNVVSAKRRSELAGVRLNNATVLATTATFMFQSSGYQDKIPNPLGVKLETHIGRHTWLKVMAAKDDSLRTHLNRFTGAAIGIRESSDYRNYWSPGVAAALWAIWIDYGDQLLSVAVEALDRGHGVEAIKAKHDEVHKDRREQLGRTLGKTHLIEDQKYELFVHAYSVILEEAQKIGVPE